VRPRRLRVKGYTAFVEEADVDFDGLDLFAITGPTGAGKTSLLQAMAIALYGRAPKLGDDLRQLISPSAEQARFYFEFRAHGRSYRIVRVLFRTRPTTVALEAEDDGGVWQPLTRGVREANARVEQILGLDFDSFTKVVLLPQNEFDAFLRGKPEERRSILTRLLSLEIYGRIQQRANQVATDARATAEVLSGLLERDYMDATPERLAEVKEARGMAQSAVEIATARLGALERAAGAAVEARHRRLAHRAASDAVTAHERDLMAAREEHGAAAGAFATIDREVHAIAGRLASISYDPDRHLLLERAAERGTRLAEVIAGLGRLDDDDASGRARTVELVHRFDACGRAVAEAERALGVAEEAEHKGRADLSEGQRRFGTRATIAALIERERRYRADCDQEGEAGRALQALAAREAELATTRADVTARHATERTRLAEAQRAAEDSQRVLDACRAMQVKAAALGERLASARGRATRARAQIEKAQTEAERRRAALVETEAVCHGAQEIARTAEGDLRHLEQAHAAHALRETLAIGQRCPVCEAKVRKVPAVQAVDDLGAARRSLAEARRRLAEAQSEGQCAAAGMAVADEALRASAAASEEARSETERLAAELDGMLPADLRGDERGAEVLQGRLDAASANRDASEREVEAGRRRVADLDAAIAGIDGELRALPAQIEERRRAAASIRRGCEETERLLASHLGGPPGPETAGTLVAMDASLREAEEALAAATAGTQASREALRAAQAASARAAGDAETEAQRARMREDERVRLARERDEIQRALREIVPGRADAVTAIGTELRALARARARRETVSQELAARQQERDRMDRQVTEGSARLGALERQRDEHHQREGVTRAAMDAAVADLAARLAAAGLTVAEAGLARAAVRLAAGEGGLAPAGDGDERDELPSMVQRAKDERDEAVSRSAELGVEEQTLAEKIGRAAECREQRDAARTRGEVSRELGQLLGANNLQTYVLADAMRVLVEDGSLHLQRLSDGRYRLQAEDLDFHVVDAWNGDAVRSVKTLSGGETFLTSLALALALAERLADLAAGAHGHEALESLFVDEGFGALDTEETLETVVQAIEALQANDRLVGIVTHLTPLAERMPAQIKVRKAPEGSRVEMVK
jgi:exonuclease SbcC